MPKGSRSPVPHGWLFSLAMLSACASASAIKPPAASPAPAPAVVPVAAAASVVVDVPVASSTQESPEFARELAKLRPDGTQPLLEALESGSGSAQAYAQAAVAFSATDVPGMTLIWGMSYQAMGGGSDDSAVSHAVSRVLVERITAERDPRTKQVSLSLRLAPGAMPTREEADGSTRAPLVHVFESLFGPAVRGFRPPWTIEQFYDVLSSWVGLVASRGTPLDDSLELDAWLVATAKAGHLEAFCHQLLGPAYGAELKAYRASHAPELKAYRTYLKTAAFSPKRAPLPDELVRVR